LLKGGAEGFQGGSLRVEDRFNLPLSKEEEVGRTTYMGKRGRWESRGRGIHF